MLEQRLFAFWKGARFRENANLPLFPDGKCRVVHLLNPRYASPLSLRRSRAGPPLNRHKAFLFVYCLMPVSRLKIIFSLQTQGEGPPLFPGSFLSPLITFCSPFSPLFVSDFMGGLFCADCSCCFSMQWCVPLRLFFSAFPLPSRAPFLSVCRPGAMPQASLTLLYSGLHLRIVLFAELTSLVFSRSVSWFWGCWILKKKPTISTI